MARTKVYRKEEDLKSVPLDQEVVVALELGSDDLSVPDEQEETDGEIEVDNDIVKTLTKQVEDLKKSNESANELLLTEQQQRRKAEQDAAELARSATQYKSFAEQSQVNQAKAALDAAQSEEKSAKTEYMTALEAGDFVKAADAQSRMSRAAAKVVRLEEAIANAPEPDEEQQRQPTRQAAPVDVMTLIDSDPKFLPAEKTFLKAHPELLTDSQKNVELGVAYNRAVAKGLSRGTPAYFEFIEEFMGYKQPKQETREDEDDADDQRSAAAPVRRDNSGGRAPLRPTQVKLTAEQRELARDMGISELGYARQLLKLKGDQAAQPEKYNRTR